MATLPEFYNNYLSQTFVLFEMVKAIGKRELSLKLIKNNKKIMTRYYRGYNLDVLNKTIERLEIKKEPRNFYISCSILPQIPFISYDLRNRRNTPEYIEFNKNYINFVTGIDIFYDFDGKINFQKAFIEAKQLKELFDEYKLPYYIINSSGKGFHIVIPAEYLPKKPVNELLKDIQTIYSNIMGIYDFEELDKSVLLDIKQLRKVPYSPTIDGYVCLPLSDEQFLQCEKSMDFLKIENVLKNIKIKNRGLMIHNIEIPEEELKKNLEKFFKEHL